MRKHLILLLFALILLPVVVIAEDVTFRAVDYYGDFVVDSHYIITVYNKNDHKWYAIGTTDDGEATAVEISNPKNGLKIDKKKIKTLNYVYTASKKPQYYTIKLRSNIKDSETGKKYSFYLNSSLFNLGGGDIRIEKQTIFDGYDATYNKRIYKLSYRNSKYLTYDSSSNTFDYHISYDYSTYEYDENGNIKSDIGNITDGFYILTDEAELPENSKEKTLYKVNTIGAVYDLTTSLVRGDKVQFVYNNNGNNYILTADGAKKVSISNNSFKTKDYLINDKAYYTYSSETNPILYGQGVSDDSLLYLFHSRYSWDSAFSIYYSLLNNYHFLDLNYDNTSGETFNEDNYYSYTSDVRLVYKDFETGHYFTDREVNPSTDEEYLNMAFNESSKFKICNSSFNGNNALTRCVGWDSNANDFVIVNNTADAILFEVYADKKTDNNFVVDVYDTFDPNSDYYSTVHTVIDHDMYRIDNKRFPWISDDGTVNYNENTYRFLGFTTDKSKAGIIALEDNENIMEYNLDNQRVELTPAMMKKYSIVEKLSNAKQENGVIKLYPVFANENTKEEPYIGKYGDKKILGVIDWKNQQGNKDLENLAKYDINQGSIYIEVYLDGELWIPKDKVYYKYHNDNAADLRIKFLGYQDYGLGQMSDEEAVKNFLYEKDAPFGKNEDNLVIVGVYAEQGGSEEGLYLPFNWISENGGLLDNVKGGSTVKVYLSAKYTSKYYLNDKLYKTDEFIYTPYVTKDVIAKNSKNSNYVVNSKTNSELLNDTKETNYFKEDDLKRGKYSSFSYEVLSEKDTMDVLDLPKQKLVYNYWIVKGQEGNVLGIAKEKEIVKISAKKDVHYLYIGSDDSIDTIHLYAYTSDYDKVPSVPKNTPIISIPKQKGISRLLKNPETASGIMLLLIFFTISFGACIYFSKRKDKTKRYNA